jgi:hypothetical protein
MSLSSSKDRFLIAAAKLGHGDCMERVDTTKVSQELDPNNKGETVYEIINSLILEGYVTDIIENRYITISRRGYYYAIKMSELPARKLMNGFELCKKRLNLMSILEFVLCLLVK